MCKKAASPHTFVDAGCVHQPHKEAAAGKVAAPACDQHPARQQAHVRTWRWGSGQGSLPFCPLPAPDRGCMQRGTASVPHSIHATMGQVVKVNLTYLMQASRVILPSHHAALV